MIKKFFKMYFFYLVVCDSGRTIEKRDDFFLKKIYSLGECKSYENMFEKQNFFASGKFYWGLKRVLREKIMLR